MVLVGGVETFSDVPIRLSRPLRQTLITLPKAMKKGPLGILKHLSKLKVKIKLNRVVWLTGCFKSVVSRLLNRWIKNENVPNNQKPDEGPEPGDAGHRQLHHGGGHGPLLRPPGMSVVLCSC
jgi:hypothetical protein